MDEHVKAFYDIATRAVGAKVAMKDAVRRGTVDQYHRVLRETPEVKLATPLTGVRRRLSELAGMRRRAMDMPARGGVDAVRQQFAIDDMTKAMSAMAHGTLLWANEQLGIVAPTAPTATTATNDAMNSGEVR
jgi:hypothetical protein